MTKEVRRVLVIEDEDPCAEELRESFSTERFKWTFQVTRAKNIEELIRKIREPFDIAVVDMWLPRHFVSAKVEKDGGMTVLEFLREGNPFALIVVYTAHPTIEHAILAVRSGAYDYVSKETTAHDLVTCIATELERHEYLAERQRKFHDETLQAHPEWLKDKRGKFVAVLEDTIVAEADEKLAVMHDVWEKYPDAHPYIFRIA